MARPRKAATKQARIAIFAHDELDVLVDNLNRHRNFNVSPPDMLGALILAARRLPLEVVEALVPAYVARERTEVERSAAETGLEES
jgi:hypothetical protein